MIHFRLLAYDQFARMTMKPNGDYPTIYISFFNLNIFNTDHTVLTNSKKSWSTSFHSHINLAWLCNLRFDYSKTFGDICRQWHLEAWLGYMSFHLFHQLHHREICNSLLQKNIHSAPIPKSCLWEHISIKFL